MWTEDMNELLIGDEWVDEFGDEMTTQDGCPIEPDGTCPHGYKSPLLRLGMI